MQLRQFVMSRAHGNFAEVTESVKTFQELIESGHCLPVHLTAVGVRIHAHVDPTMTLV